jgi:hypothetical protein
LEPEQPAATTTRTFTKGRLMQVHLPADETETVAEEAAEPVAATPPGIPQTSKFDARASGGASAPTTDTEDADEAVYSVRGREVVDLREETRREAEAQLTVDLTEDVVEAHRSETYYQRHSANLPHLTDQDFDRPAPAKGHAKK